LTVGSSADTLEFFQKCREAGVRLVFGMKADFDAFPEGLLAEVLRYSSVIFTNQTEREEIEKRLGMNSITELLGSANASVLVTTMGGRGSLYYEKRGGGIVSGETAASPCARVIDATGSGDAYISGFLYGLLKGCDTDSCCRLGSVLASFVIERMGCCEGAPDEGALLRRYRGEE
jgi:sugar/nucleoside kinase (ribokinase family)